MSEIDTDPLTGDRVRLRAVAEEDLPTLSRWWSDPQVAIHQALAAPSPRPAGDIAEMIRQWSKNDGADCGFAITTFDDGELVGHAALFGVTPKDRCATYAVFIGPEHQNRGLGTETTRLMLRYGFEEMNLHRIQLEVFGYNHRAIAAYAKAGFVEEGRRRSAIYRTGQWYDHVLMGILRPEWEAARAAW